MLGSGNDVGALGEERGEIGVVGDYVVPDFRLDVYRTELETVDEKAEIRCG